MSRFDAGLTVWPNGLPSAGKTTLALSLGDRLRCESHRVEVLDAVMPCGRCTTGGSSRSTLRRPSRCAPERDVKGLYAKQRGGILVGLTGVDDPYEPPTAPELVVIAHDRPLQDYLEEIWQARMAP